MRLIGSIVTIFILCILFYFTFTAIIPIGWAIGGVILSLIVFLVLFEILDRVIGWGTIGAILLALILLQLFFW